MIDLEKLKAKFDKLYEETSYEQFHEWLEEKRKTEEYEKKYLADVERIKEILFENLELNLDIENEAITITLRMGEEVITSATQYLTNSRGEIR